MESFSNVKLFYDAYSHETPIPEELFKLFIFTTYSKFEGEFFSKFVWFHKNISKEDKYSYVFYYGEKSYSFSVFSDYELQDYDKKKLKSNKRMNESLARTLKLACSLDFVTPKVVIGSSSVDTFSLLILFSDHGTNKVIDYSKNLVMNQDDYYNLFQFCELNVMDKFDLYQIYYLINSLHDEKHIYEYLIFSKELFREFAKCQFLSPLFRQYDINGFHSHNYLLFGSDSEALFFQKEDVGQLKYEKLVQELNAFTENPTLCSKHISYDKKNSCYKLKDRKFGSFSFKLLSDYVLDSDIKKELLSKNRYHECHQNSIMIACSLDENDAYVVGGKFLENEKDYFYHSWVEIEDNNTVIDYNHNIIMNRDKYYDFFGVEVINRISAMDVKSVIQTSLDFGFSFHPMYINYFGQEFMSSFQKNQKILERR